MLRLPFGVSSGDHRSRLAQPESKISKQPLALPHAQGNTESLLDEGRQALSIPEGYAQPHIAGRLAYYNPDIFDLFLGKSCRSTLALSLGKPCEPLFLEPMYPVLHGSGGVSQQPGDFRAFHPLRDEQNAVKPMIVARITRTANLVLQSQHNLRRIGNRQWSHATSRAQPGTIRNYL